MSGLNVGDCAATGCPASVPAGKLMCLPHWRSVPADIRAELNSSWNAHRTNMGRLFHDPDRRPTPEQTRASRTRYDAARTAAIDSLPAFGVARA